MAIAQQRINKVKPVSIAAMSAKKQQTGAVQPQGLGLVAALAAHLAAQHRNAQTLAPHAGNDPYQQFQQRQSQRSLSVAPSGGGIS